MKRYSIPAGGRIYEQKGAWIRLTKDELDVLEMVAFTMLGRTGSEVLRSAHEKLKEASYGAA